MSENPRILQTAGIFGSKQFFPPRKTYWYSSLGENRFRSNIPVVCDERGFWNMLCREATGKMKSSPLLFFAVLFITTLIALAPSARAAPLLFQQTDVTVTLTDPAISFTVVNGSTADSFVVRSGSVEVTTSEGQTFTMTSASRGLSASGQTGTVNVTCSADRVANLDIPSTNNVTQTVTISPTSDKCGASAVVAAAGSGGGGGGGGGGGPIAPFAPAATSTAATSTVIASTPVVPGSRADLENQLAALLAQLRVLQERVTGASTAPLTSAAPAPAGGVSTHPVYVFKKPLAFGSRGSDVRALQESLTAEGSGVYPEGTVSGYFGALTRKAVERFQQKYGIAQPGVAGFGTVGPKTRAKLNELSGR